MEQTKGDAVKLRKPTVVTFCITKKKKRGEKKILFYTCSTKHSSVDAVGVKTCFFHPCRWRQWCVVFFLDSWIF